MIVDFQIIAPFSLYSIKYIASFLLLLKCENITLYITDMYILKTILSYYHIHTIILHIQQTQAYVCLSRRHSIFFCIIVMVRNENYLIYEMQTKLFEKYGCN